MLAQVATALAAASLATGSVTWTRDARDNTSFEGTACSQPASTTVDLPAGAFDVVVAAPKVGATVNDVRVTEVRVDGSKVTFTASSNCDPNDPEAQQWFARFDYRITYTTHATVTVVRDWAHRPPYYVLGPKSIRIELVGAVERIRWQRFGGKTAIGFGTMNQDGCKHAKCLGQGARIKVVLRNPSHCSGDDHVFYNRVSFITTHKLGVLKPGTEWYGYKPDCGSFPAIPVH